MVEVWGSAGFIFQREEQGLGFRLLASLTDLSDHTAAKTFFFWSESVQYSDHDWEKLNKREMRQGVAEVVRLHLPPNRTPSSTSAAVGLPAGDGQAVGCVAAAAWRTNFAAVDLPTGDRQARGGVAAAEEE